MLLLGSEFPSLIKATCTSIYSKKPIGQIIIVLRTSIVQTEAFLFCDNSFALGNSLVAYNYIQRCHLDSGVRIKMQTLIQANFL